MGLPIIGDIYAFISDSVKNALDIIPRQLKFILFLFLITIIGGALLPIFLNFMGVFCINDVQATGSVLHPVNNLNTFLAVMELREEDINSTGYLDVELNCVKLINNFTYYDGGYCTNCTRINNTNPAYDSEYGGNNLGRCGDDAYRIAEVNKSWGQKAFCESLGVESWIATGCEPPLNYRYDYTIEKYLCLDNTVCGNETPQMRIINDLRVKGYDIKPINSTDDTPGWLPVVSCVKQKPRITLFGLDIFDIKVWLFFIFLGLLWFIYAKVQQNL